MGQAALFTPPSIHKRNLVILPKYLLSSRLKQFCKLIKGKYTRNEEGLITVMNDVLEFQYKTFHQHIQLEEITYTPKSIPDAIRCLEFIKYESYLLQKPVYCVHQDPLIREFLKEQGFRLLNEEERQEIYETFWEKEPQKV